MNKLMALPQRHQKNTTNQMEPSQRKTQKKHEVRGLLCNIPNIDAFIVRRTAVYLGKVTRSNNNPKKNLAAWINGKRKNGAPQLTCNNNYFVNSIQKIIPPEKILSNKQALLREWIPLAKDESNWIISYIDTYFESCRNTDFEDPNNDLPAEDEEELS